MSAATHPLGYELLSENLLREASHGFAAESQNRMVTLCDVYMAMTECRPYGIRYNSLGALERMARKGGRLDQRLVNAFGEMILQIDASEAAHRISYSVTEVQVKTRS